jgi:hypothetical protein
MPLDAATDSISRKAMIDEVRRQGSQLFDKRGSLMTLFQCLAEQFYPERADFTVTRTLGEDMAAHLMSSYPVVTRRDLGNSFSAMLRPTAKPWFHVRSSRPDKEVTDARQWLEWATDLQRNAMYDPLAQFTRATKETDHDFATFGQGVIEHDLYRPRDGKTPHLLFRNWHLRDVAWCESVTGKIDTIYRRWKPTALDLRRLFGDRIHRKVAEKLTQRNPDPYCEFNVWHVILPSDIYREMPGAKPIRQPFVSLFIDIDNEHEMECVGQWTRRYTIPRWQTVSGSQYAHSPATVAALPDSRLLQAITLVLLEAGEKAVNPPLIATQDVVRSDIATYAGGTTWVSEEYDEKLGEALRPMTIDKSGLQFGIELSRDIKQSLKDAFFLSKLDLPPVGGPEMTAYEVGQRVQEYIRNALPLFEPMEQDYNAALCDDVFTTLMMNSPEMRQSVPKSIQGSEIRFQFESPLREAADRAKAGQFVEASQIISTATQLDPTTAMIVDGQKATRDVLLAVAPADWLRTEDTVDQMIQSQQAQQQQEKLLALMAQGTQIAKTGAEAAATASEALPGYGLS